MRRNGLSPGLKTWTLLAAFVATTGCTDTQQMVESADLVLKGGRILTLDEGNPVAEAIALKGAWIVAVGSDSEIESYVGDTTRVIDLEGRLAIPGFIEGHGHFMNLGEAKTVLDLTNATSWEETVDMVAVAVREAEQGDWIQGRGWHQEKWLNPPPGAVEGYPVHASISDISPDNPVLLTHASGHAAFVNARALEVAGLSRESPDPPGGELGRDSQGDLTGLLRETAQRSVVGALQSHLGLRSPAEVEAHRRLVVRLASEEALVNGVTSFHDAGSSFETIDFFKQLETERGLEVRLYVMVGGESNEAMAQRLAEYRSTATGDDYLVVRSIKRQIDGALGSHSAWLLEPYADLSDSVGLVSEPEAEIQRTAEIALKEGYQVNTHAIGDRANRAVLDLYQDAFAANNNSKNLRWRIEHAQHLSLSDLPRFSELGVIASVQGIHCTSDAPWVLRRLGSDRASKGAYRWRDLIDSGAILINGTDVPVESINPIESFYASVGRLTLAGEPFYPQQSMTRDEALRSYTLNAAFAAFEEDLKGSIKVDKLADIVVLSKDIMSIPLEEIPSAQVDLTIVGGQVRYGRQR